ncbi:hypothetical protein [Mucilaginibacter corticis]|uniref:hypothetical protein n=1 Tax=Mucilaginibacter corticis TaxID=2597670 RepID=UPI00164278D3|nr:hypothetical protein [Mucilaginibacter corticis]
MKTTVHFLLTLFISTGALLGSTKSNNPLPYLSVTVIVWMLFAWRVSRRCDRSKFKR